MSTVLQKSSRYVAQNEMILASLPGQDLAWLKAIRQNALSEFSATGFPSPREEEWKYTNIAPIERKLFTPVVAPRSDIKPALIEDYRLTGMDSLVFVDGHFCPTLSSLPALSDGVIIAGMKDALHQYPYLVEAHLGRIADRHAPRFVTKLKIPPMPSLSPGYQFCTVEYFISARSSATSSTTAACN